MRRMISQVVLKRGFQLGVKSAAKQFSTNSANVYPGAFLNADEVRERVFTTVKTVKFAPENLEDDHVLGRDLKFDSELRKSLQEKLEAEFCVKMPKEVTDNIASVRSIVDYFSTHPKAR